MFDRATAPAPWTVPSLGALFTGRYPAEVGAYTNGDGIHPDFTTLAELFQAHGYATASFNTHALLIARARRLPPGLRHRLPAAAASRSWRASTRCRTRCTEPHLMQWLEEHAREPFFVWVHDMDPHLPPTTGNPYLDDPAWSRYDAEVRWMDEAVGRILARLRALGLGDDLLVVFTADHGEAFGDEHGLSGHQDVMYDEVLRIPLLVQYPGMGSPRRIAEPVELLDVYRDHRRARRPAAAGRHARREPGAAARRDARPARDTVRRSTPATSSRTAATGWRCATASGSCWRARAIRDRNAVKRGAPRWDLDDQSTYFELYRIADDPRRAERSLREAPRADRPPAAAAQRVGRLRRAGADAPGAGRRDARGAARARVCP